MGRFHMSKFFMEKKVQIYSSTYDYDLKLLLTFEKKMHERFQKKTYIRYFMSLTSSENHLDKHCSSLIGNSFN